MKRTGLSLVLLFCIYLADAQDIVVGKLRNETSRSIKKEADTTTWNWKRGGLMSFSLTQGSLSNWAAGGDNFSLAANAYLNYYFYFRKNRHSWDNNLDVNFGFVQTTSLGGRKNDDRIDYLSKYGYKIDSLGTWYMSMLFNFRSQFFDGYTYSTGTGELSSSILSPAYVIVSAGFDWKPSTKFSVFLSPLTSRSTFVVKQSLADKGVYGVPKGDNSISQVGAFATVNYNNPALAKNVGYKGRLDLFSNYSNHPQNVDIYMTNLFAFKINKNFSATYNLDLIYDDDIRLFGPTGTSPGLQLKSMIGLAYLQPLAVRKVTYKPIVGI